MARLSFREKPMSQVRLAARALVVAAGVLIAAASAQAQHKHSHDHKPKHGGLIREAGGFVYELVAKPTEIVVHVTDEADKPVPVRGSTARVTLIDSGTRVEVPLAAGNDNRHSAAGSFPVKAGMSALLEVAVGGKPVAKLRYTLK
jgi:hypothetical protein